MIEYLIIGALVLGAMYAHTLWIRWRTKHLEKHAAAMEEFYAAANVLCSDSDTPIAILSLLRFMNHKAMRASSAREFIWIVILKRQQIARQPQIDSIESFIKERPELSIQFSKACSTAFEALAYRSPFAGIFLRVFVIFDGREHPDRTKELAENYCVIEQHAAPLKNTPALEAA